jgi:hypothetical protein
MLNLLRALERRCRSFWQPRDRMRGLRAHPTEKRPARRDSPAEVRARFWDAVREGQREAEALSAKRRP